MCGPTELKRQDCVSLAFVVKYEVNSGSCKRCTEYVKLNFAENINFKNVRSFRKLVNLQYNIMYITL